MTYQARTHGTFFIFLFALINVMITDIFNFITGVSVVLILLLLLGFIRYKLHIEDKEIHYFIYNFNFHMYKKRVTPDQITQIKFKRIGWAKKCAVLKVNKGFNVRVADFYPDEVYEELESFADKYNILVVKTKDYKIVSKMNRVKES